MKERRSHFLINKSLQFRYMGYITASLFSVAMLVIVSLYFGIWGNLLDAFSDEQLRNDLLIASRMAEYESARISSGTEDRSAISFFRQAEKLSVRQREIFKQILDQTNRDMLPRFLLLLFLIAWGSIYLTHKIAGPLYRFQIGLEDIEKGTLTSRIHLRKSDEAQFLGDQFNRTAEHLDFSVAKLKNIITENEANPERLKSRLKEELAKLKTSADR